MFIYEFLVSIIEFYCLNILTVNKYILSEEILFIVLVHLMLLMSNNRIFMKSLNLGLFSLQECQEANFSEKEW